MHLPTRTRSRFFLVFSIVWVTASADQPIAAAIAALIVVPSLVRGLGAAFGARRPRTTPLLSLAKLWSLASHDHQGAASGDIDAGVSAPGEEAGAVRRAQRVVMTSKMAGMWAAYQAEAVYQAEAAGDPFSPATHRALANYHRALMAARTMQSSETETLAMETHETEAILASFFLLTFSRRGDDEPTLETFANSVDAMERFVSSERLHRDQNDGYGVVLLIAEDEETLRRTHTHYFATGGGLIDARPDDG